MWMIVVYLNIIPGFVTITGTYSTQERCMAAAEAINTNAPVFNSARAACIPAPDDLYDTHE